MKNSAEFNNCFIIHSKYFPVLNGVSPFRSLFFCSPKSQFRPQVFSVNGWIICSGLHFWRHFDVNGWIICSGLHFWRHWLNMTKILSKFGEQQLVMVNYACGFNQSETGKYFEWIIMLITARDSEPIRLLKTPRSLSVYILTLIICSFIILSMNPIIWWTLN